MPHPMQDLHTLIASIEPELSDDQYLFCAISQDRRDRLVADPVVEVREPEGVTVVLRQEDAWEEKVEGRFLSRMITLTVARQRFDSPGVMATIAARLAGSGISIEPVSGYYHGYLFVPAARAEESLRILKRLAEEYRERGRAAAGQSPG